MKLSLRPSLRVLAGALAAGGLLASCGGGDSAPATTSVSGTVVKGPVSGADVCAYRAASGGKGEKITCVKTNASGGYSMDLQVEGDVVIEALGGTYTDEATNTTKTLSDPMQVVVSAKGGTTTGVVTPLTTVAYNFARGASGGLSSASFASAATNVAGQFNLTGVNIASVVPTVTGAQVDAYGRTLRAVSQYLANGGSFNGFANFTSPSTLQAAFATAYASINGSSVNFTFTLPSGAGGGASGGTGGGTGGATGGTKTLTVSVSVSGAPAVTSATIQNVPAPGSESEFCGALANDSTFSSIGAAGGGSLTINSCSFSGGTGTINATLRITAPVAMTLPYVVTYRYQ